ncbi:sensor histidine kinase [Ideonella sp. TBM-1]|uniref:Sensor histidine kinase n=1 Tax=Ideonella livida TaxID=2707176 RepID=A0A7C9PGV0_9BURK|nr:sensor histidine kinase [Ideonella livida]
MREVVLSPDALQPGALPLCGNGALLRAVLLVHGLVGVGLLFGAGLLQDWLAAFSAASLQSLPSTLLWLVMVCLFRAPLSRLSPWLQLAGVGGLAGGLSLMMHVLLSRLGLAAEGAGTGLASLLAGAMAGVLVYQLERGRQRARLPVSAAARLADLQTRIRPHFLFNTLNTAITLVQTDPRQAEEVLEDLSDLFRAALGGLDEAKTLEEEIVLSRRYLAIEQLRFGPRLEVRWDLDPAAGTARLPPLALQPLVENAVRHGVEPSDRPGKIDVRTRRRRDRVLISVTNTLPRDNREPRRGHGIGMASVRERLRLMYDLDADFRSGLTEDGRWRVSLSVPAS